MLNYRRVNLVSQDTNSLTQKCWHLHTYLMLRHEEFFSTSCYAIFYILYYLMLRHKNFSWCYAIRTSLELMLRRKNKWSELRIKWSVGKLANEQTVPVILNVLTLFMAASVSHIHHHLSLLLMVNIPLQSLYYISLYNIILYIRMSWGMGWFTPFQSTIHLWWWLKYSHC